MAASNLSGKQSIKRLEIPISKFNDVAIPHHLNLLRRHKTNIKRFRRMRDWESVRKEQINAARLTKQLEQLLYEMDTLRAQVQDEDIEKFDKLTLNARMSTMEAIKEYFEETFEPPVAVPIKSDSPEDEDQAPTDPLEERQIQLNAEEEDLERQKACLHAWNSLQKDLHQLHQLFVDFNQMIQDQRENVDKVESNVEESEVNVQEGLTNLQRASRYKAAVYPIAGALLGTCIGGPVGLIAGMKIGGLTAIGGGLIGLTGATLLKKKIIKDENSEIELRNRQNASNSSLTSSMTSIGQDTPRLMKKRL